MRAAGPSLELDATLGAAGTAAEAAGAAGTEAVGPAATAVVGVVNSEYDAKAAKEALSSTIMATVDPTGTSLEPEVKTK
jgi:hypothetical protein